MLCTYFDSNSKTEERGGQNTKAIASCKHLLVVFFSQLKSIGKSIFTTCFRSSDILQISLAKIEDHRGI